MSLPEESEFRTKTSVSMIALHRRLEGLDDRTNDGTMVAFLPKGIGARQELAAHGAFEPKDIFRHHFTSIREAVELHHHHVGALVFAFDGEAQALGHVWVKATPQKTRALVFGRHTLCGLVVTTEAASVALRHLVFLVRGVGDRHVRVRAVDLRTHIGFIDESRRVLRGVVADGPFFLGIGGICVFVMMTGSGPLPGDADSAYASLPQRSFLEADENTLFARKPPPDERRTDVSSLRGPVEADRDKLLGSKEPIVGVLDFGSDAEGFRKAVGARALNRGILVGRYGRCQLESSEGSVSRVHLLLVQDENDLLAVDTASTNGSTFLGEPIQTHKLEHGHVLRLANKLDLRWLLPSA